MNTLDFLSIASAVCPERTAVSFEGTRFSFAQLEERSHRLAQALRRLGVGPGEKVAILQVGTSQYLESYFATALAGGVFVPLNFRARRDELTYLINHSEALVLLVGERYTDMVEDLLPSIPWVRHLVALDGPRPGWLHYQDLLSVPEDEEPLPEVDDEDVTLLVYTSGTSGRPKVVPLAHSNIASYMADNVQPADPDVEETNLLCVPPYHVAGLQGMLAAVYGGRTIAMLRQFDADDWLRTVEQEKVNRSMLVPTMLKRVVEHPDFSKYDLSSLRVLTYGAAPMPFEVIKKAIEMLPGVRFINAFGQTETAATVTALGPDDHDLSGTPEEREKKLKRLAGSIGRPLPGVRMAVVDEQGREMPLGEVGEIVVQGGQVMKGYWKDAEKSAQAIDDRGWLHTSDMGWRDEENYFYLAGRGDDMVIRGGENISPEEVEQVLHSHPQIEEAALIGVPDPDWGQEPWAVVVLKSGAQATAEEITEFCRQRLASYKCPRSVVFVDSLPRNPMGKVVRRLLREQYGTAPVS
jgi:acyl-CoA synthetase (AMP-forming)/AMP-acid ligase II